MQPTDLLSPHISLATFIRSNSAIRAGIDNSLPDALIERAKTYCNEGVEKVRSILGDHRLSIHSMWRCPALNAILPGSSPTSEHMRANAMDFDINDVMSLPAAFKILVNDPTLLYSQLMIEGVSAAHPNGGWIHYALDTHLLLNNMPQKMEIKVVKFTNEEPHYITVSKDEANKWCDERI